MMITMLTSRKFGEGKMKTAAPMVRTWFSRGTLGKCRGRDLRSSFRAKGPWWILFFCPKTDSADEFKMEEELTEDKLGNLRKRRNVKQESFQEEFTGRTKLEN